MNLTLLNGSPRGKNSNSQVMLNWIIQGYNKDTTIYNLNIEKNHKEAIESCINSDVIYMVLPLYFDSMPGQVMKFFESLYKQKEGVKGKTIGFFIHSGFPEGQQSFILREILENIANKLELEILTTVIRGGSEPTRLMPENMQKKNKSAIVNIGISIKNNEDIKKTSIDTLIKPVKLSETSQVLMKIGGKLGLTNMHWNSELKKNNALDKSFDRPYLR